jgi:hypothetical protein
MILGKSILMSRIIYLFPFLFLLTAFAHREPDYCKMVDRITENYLKEMAEPRGLTLSGYGGAMMDDIQRVTLRFLSHDALNVDEARILYVEMMGEFLRRINCHEKVRPHLHNFPFEDDNIKLTISFVNSEGHTIRDGHVALMSIARDHKLYFAAYNPDIEDFYTLCEESYEEARRKVTGH